MNRLDEELVEKIQEDIKKDHILEDLYNEYKIEELLMFNEHNLMDKIRDTVFISEHFRLLYLKEANILRRIEIIYETKVGTMYDHYKYENEKELSKTEIEKYYLPKDEKVNKIKELVNKQKLRTDFFESVWKALDKMSWVLKMYQQEIKGN